VLGCVEGQACQDGGWDEEKSVGVALRVGELMDIWWHCRSLSYNNKPSKSGGLTSGYNPAWLKENVKNKANKADKAVIGGLTDDDAFDERPDFPNS
jgi:hypothetical protein